MYEAPKNSKTIILGETLKYKQHGSELRFTALLWLDRLNGCVEGLQLGLALWIRELTQRLECRGFHC